MRKKVRPSAGKLNYQHWNFRWFTHRIPIFCFWGPHSSKEKQVDRSASRSVVSLCCFAYYKVLRLLPKSKVGGIPQSEAYHEKIRLTSTLTMKFSFKWKFPTWAPLRTLKNSLFFKFNLQTSLFKFYLQTTFFKFYLQTALVKFYLQLQSTRFFRQIVQFQVIKNLLKKSKIK